MKKEWKKLLVVACAAILILTIIKPNIYLILANFALVMFLLKKGWLTEAGGEGEVNGPKDASENNQQLPENKK